jgi:hydroxypyruvate reductase
MSQTSGVNGAASALRATARGIFQHALEESSIERGFARSVHYQRGILQVGEDLYPLADYSKVFVVSIGKGAHTSLQALMERLGAGAGVTGIVSAPTPPAAQVPGFRYFEGGHPMPNHESLKAAAAILKSLDGLDEHALVIYLLSGGGSAIAERPIDDDISFDDLVQTYRALVHSGAPIALINAVRKHISAVKGGRLALAAAPARQVSILISDVPDNALDSLASGPTMPDTSTVEQCYQIAQTYDLIPRLPESVARLFRTHALEETPKKSDPIFERARWWPILSNVGAQQAAAERAKEQGFHVEIDNSCDDWDYRKAADYLLERLRQLRQQHERVCLVSGGEVTVVVDAKPGQGGRNQQFALYCAQRIGGENITVLSAGTDGIDGASPAAGSVADGTTLARAKEKGLDAEAALKGFDAYPFFHALGDTIMTGYTGTNVRDIRLLLAV